MKSFTFYSIELSKYPTVEEIKNAVHAETVIFAEDSDKATELFKKDHPNHFIFSIHYNENIKQPKTFPGI